MLSLAFMCFTRQSPGEALAARIAHRMKDTLSLTDSQEAGIYEANLVLHRRKNEVWKNSPSRDSVAAKLQQIEDTRNRLYQPILTDQQYRVYLSKKATLISN